MNLWGKKRNEEKVVQAIMVLNKFIEDNSLLSKTTFFDNDFLDKIRKYEYHAVTEAVYNGVLVFQHFSKRKIKGSDEYVLFSHYSDKRGNEIIRMSDAGCLLAKEKGYKIDLLSENDININMNLEKAMKTIRKYTLMSNDEIVYSYYDPNNSVLIISSNKDISVLNQ